MPKITEFSTITTLANEDVFTIIDVSATPPSTGTNKIINASNAANSLASKITEVPSIVSNALTAKANIASPTFTGNVVLPSTTTIGDISSTELSYLNGVTSSIQTQLDAISGVAGSSSPTFSGTVTAASFVGPLTGNASTASTLQTARAIACSGDIVGTTNFNGSANVSIATTLSDGVVSPSKLSTGRPTWNTAGTLTATLFSGPLTGTASGNIKQGGGTGQGNNNIYIGWNSPTGPKLRVQVDNTDFSSTWPIDISGNAATATTATTATALTQPYTLATAQTSTGVTSIDFTGIPSWVKRVTVLFRGLSTNGTSLPIVQVGDGSIKTSGYLGSASRHRTDSTSANFTDGFGLTGNIAAASVIHGIMTIYKITGNSWVAAFSGGASDDVHTYSGGGSVVLSGSLDRIRLTTQGGVNNFDAGEINIAYE